jgi:hypothetical protein
MQLPVEVVDKAVEAGVSGSITIGKMWGATTCSLARAWAKRPLKPTTLGREIMIAHGSPLIAPLRSRDAPRL